MISFSKSLVSVENFVILSTMARFDVKILHLIKAGYLTRELSSQCSTDTTIPIPGWDLYRYQYQAYDSYQYRYCSTIHFDINTGIGIGMGPIPIPGIFTNNIPVIGTVSYQYQTSYLYLATHTNTVQKYKKSWVGPINASVGHFWALLF